MTIPPAAYENLTQPQRIRAAVSAAARNDDAEIETLKASAGFKTYRITNPEFSDSMQALAAIVFSHECEQRGLALEWYARQAAEIRTAADAERILGELGSAEAGLAKFAELQGIDAAELLAMAPRHSTVEALAAVASDFVDEEMVAEFAKAYGQFYASAC